MAFDRSSARARLSSSSMRASVARCNRLKITTTAPTIDVMLRTCLALMPTRISGRLRLEAGGWRLEAGLPGVSLLALPGPEPELVQLVVKRLEADAENLGGARLVVTGVLERHQDQPPLGLRNGHTRSERHLRLLGRPQRFGRERRRQVLGFDEWSRGEYGCALDD